MNAHSLISQARQRGTFKTINSVSEAIYSSGGTAYYRGYNKKRGALTFSVLSGGQRNLALSKDAFPIAYTNSNTIQEASYL